jgi:hypothetical protein
MFIYSQYTLSYLSITVSSVYIGKCAHSYPQESLVREPAAQKSDGDLIVEAPGSRSSACLLFRGLRHRGVNHSGHHEEPLFHTYWNALPLCYVNCPIGPDTHATSAMWPHYHMIML